MMLGLLVCFIIPVTIQSNVTCADDIELVTIKYTGSNLPDLKRTGKPERKYLREQRNCTGERCMITLKRQYEPGESTEEYTRTCSTIANCRFKLNNYDVGWYVDNVAVRSNTRALMTGALCVSSQENKLKMINQIGRKIMDYMNKHMGYQWCNKFPTSRHCSGGGKSKPSTDGNSTTQPLPILLIVSFFVVHFVFF